MRPQSLHRMTCEPTAHTGAVSLSLHFLGKSTAGQQVATPASATSVLHPQRNSATPTQTCRADCSNHPGCCARQSRQREGKGTQCVLHTRKTAADLAAAGIGDRQLGGVLGEDGVEHAKVDAHVAQALRAQRARVVVARVLREAVAVHEVPARQLLRSQPSPSTACTPPCQLAA